MNALLVVLVVDIAVVLIGGVWMIRKMDQKARDFKRKTYRLNYAADLSPEQVETWIHAICGTLRGGRWNLTGRPSIVFELFASSHGIIHRLKVPYGHESYIIPQLRIAGVNATPEQDFDTRDWTQGLEVGLKHTTSPMRIPDTQAVSTRLLGCFNNFEPDQAMLMQVVVTPAPPVTLPIKGEAQRLDPDLKFLHIAKEPSADDVQGWRTKLAEPNFNGTIRIAAYAQTPAAARELSDRVRKALASLRGPKTRFYRRLVTMNELRERLRRGAMPVVAPLQVSASELSSLIAWPMGRPMIPGLAPVMTRHIPIISTVPTTGRVIGMSTMPGNERPVAMPYKHAVRHMHIAGPNGTGKSTLMANMAAQDMERGYGVILIETKGDLFQHVLARIPDKRLDDVIIIDVDDQEMPVGFNLLDQGSSRSSVDEMSAVINALYSDVSRSLQAPQVIYHMLHALAEVPGHTFIDLVTLLGNFPSNSPEAEWQDSLSRQVKNKDVKAWLQRFMNMSKTERDRLAGPVYNRTWEFTARPEIKRILGQRKSSFRMTDVIQNNKILLINLNGTRVGQQTAMIAGTLFANAVWQAAREVKVDKPNFLWLDEFQDIAKFPIGLESMLAKARSFGLGAVLGHQHTGQLTTDIRAAVMANTATKVVFQTTADDARVMTREFGSDIKDADFLNLARYQAIVRVATDTGMSPPATVATLPPSRETRNEAKARAWSRNVYGRPIEDVERDLDTLPGTTDKPRPPKRKITGGDVF